MSALTHAVRFANRQGLGLVGIVHEPAADRRLDVAVVLLSPGVKNRVAPHRLVQQDGGDVRGAGLLGVSLRLLWSRRLRRRDR